MLSGLWKCDRIRVVWPGVPGPDAGFKLLGGGAPGDAHEAAVLQGQPGPALHWLIARAHTGVVVGRKVGEGGWTPTSHHSHSLLHSGLCLLLQTALHLTQRCGILCLRENS